MSRNFIEIIISLKKSSEYEIPIDSEQLFFFAMYYGFVKILQYHKDVMRNVRYTIECTQYLNRKHGERTIEMVEKIKDVILELGCGFSNKGIYFTLEPEALGLDILNFLTDCGEFVVDFCPKLPLFFFEKKSNILPKQEDKKSMKLRFFLPTLYFSRVRLTIF